MPFRSDAARNASEFVQLLREFLAAYAALRDVFDVKAPGDVCFEAISGVVGDDHRSVLYRLKERSHALFRFEAFASAAVQQEALLDLTVGSLFHEAMKLREGLYQRDVYAPRVTLLREAIADVGADGRSDPLLGDFEGLLDRSGARIDEVVAEVRVLLSQTRDQFRRVLIERAGERGVTRFLISRREQVEIAFPEGFCGLVEAMHGDVVTGLIEASHAFLESAYFLEALRSLREAERLARAPRTEITQLQHYAEGMQAFLNRDYLASLAALEAWVDLDGHDDEKELARRADSALGRVSRLVENDEAGGAIVDGAKRLQLRLDTAPI